MPKTGPVHHLFVDDYEDRLNQAYGAVVAAEKSKITLLNGEEHPAVTLAGEYTDLRDEANAAAEKANRFYQVRLLPRGEWKLLAAAHPSRLEGDPDDVKADRLAGLNTLDVREDLLHVALVKPAAVACEHDQVNTAEICTSDNPCSHRAAYEVWISETIGDGEFEAMVQEAWTLANTARVDPKALPSSPTKNFDES